MEAVSVVIPTFNRAALLPRTLNSVLAGLDAGDRIIVVDDGSTDDTAAVVGAAEAPWQGCVRYLRVPNGGAGRARNAGIAAAKSDLIAFADSDDTWLPHRLKIQRPLMMRQSSLAFCFSNFAQEFPDGRIVNHWLVHWSGDERSWDEILAPGRAYEDYCPPAATSRVPASNFRVHIGSLYRQELAANYINVNTLLVRRSVVGDAFHFGVDLPTYEDWECFARITRVGPCAYLDLDTAVQFGHDGPRLTQAGQLASAQARITLIERTWARDPEFMRAHGAQVEAIVRAQRRTLVRQLIRLGRRQEARAALGRLDRAWLERLALMLPSRLLKAFLARS
jgi:glycosyltransferase involved in cell wall biosynthesis